MCSWKAAGYVHDQPTEPINSAKLHLSSLITSSCKKIIQIIVYSFIWCLIVDENTMGVGFFGYRVSFLFVRKFVFMGRRDDSCVYYPVNHARSKSYNVFLSVNSLAGPAIKDLSLAGMNFSTLGGRRIVDEDHLDSTGRGRGNMVGRGGGSPLPQLRIRDRMAVVEGKCVGKVVLVMGRLSVGVGWVIDHPLQGGYAAGK
ncbi:hypothetical protein B0H14DRAFT_2569276 [Mycena olivaceomarginata]|nr:hypothetical protein B0H14DRAFT_2569276 [Mycena olivaceomarginata]